MDDWIPTVILTGASSVFTGGVMYGMFKTKLADIEGRLDKAILESRDDRKDLREEQKNFVTINHFEAVIYPLRRAIETVEMDVKEILKAVKH